MLNGILALHDIRDTEAFARRILQRSWIQLTPDEHDDLLAGLIEEAWLLSRRYRPGGISFSTWAGNTLEKRIIDWERQRNGRYRPYPQLVEFDDTLPDSSPPPDWNQALRELELGRDRHRTWDLTAVLEEMCKPLPPTPRSLTL